VPSGLCGRWTRILLLIAACACCCRPAPAGADANREYEIKAALLYNFVKFVEWPSQAGSTLVRSFSSPGGNRRASTTRSAHDATRTHDAIASHLSQATTRSYPSDLPAPASACAGADERRSRLTVDRR